MNQNKFMKQRILKLYVSFKNINILIKVRVQFLLLKQYIFYFQFSMSHIFIANCEYFNEKKNHGLSSLKIWKKVILQGSDLSKVIFNFINSYLVQKLFAIPYSVVYIDLSSN